MTVMAGQKNPVTSQVLMDGFGRRHTYLRISVTDRCNLRCQYCMPPEGISWKTREEILTFEEIERLARIFVNLGIRKIRLTGGEPLVRENIETLVNKLSTFPRLKMLAMTTNGIFLAEKANMLKQAGLSSVNISLDSLKAERFHEVTRRNGLDKVLAGIDAALTAGLNPVKVNVVVIDGFNQDEILDFVDFARNTPVNVRFIEFMPFKNNQWQAHRIFPYTQMRALISEQFQLLPVLAESSAVARDFMIPGFQGTISFVASMTASFCSTCSRVRMTADGAIKPCLLHPEEHGLRDAMRGGATDEMLAVMIQQAIDRKPIGHEPLESLEGSLNRSMIQIGG